MLKYCASFQRHFEHLPNAVGANAQNQGLVSLTRSRSHFYRSSADILYFLENKTIIQRVKFTI